MHLEGFGGRGANDAIRKGSVISLERNRSRVEGVALHGGWLVFHHGLHAKARVFLLQDRRQAHAVVEDRQGGPQVLGGDPKPFRECRSDTFVISRTTCTGS